MASSSSSNLMCRLSKPGERRRERASERPIGRQWWRRSRETVRRAAAARRHAHVSQAEQLDPPPMADMLLDFSPTVTTLCAPESWPLANSTLLFLRIAWAPRRRRQRPLRLRSPSPSACGRGSSRGRSRVRCAGEKKRNRNRKAQFEHNDLKNIHDLLVSAATSSSARRAPARSPNTAAASFAARSTSSNTKCPATSVRTLNVRSSSASPTPTKTSSLSLRWRLARRGQPRLSTSIFIRHLHLCFPVYWPLLNTSTTLSTPYEAACHLSPFPHASNSSKFTMSMHTIH